MNIAEYKNIVIEVRPLLLRVSNKITSNMDDAEDVVQEVCLRLWHMRNDVGQYKNIKALCVTMTRNLSIDKVRLQRNDLRDESLANVLNDVRDMPDSILEIKDIQSIVRGVIKKLPPLQQQVLHLKDIEGYETDEVVSIVGISSEAVRNNLSRARKKLREIVEMYYKNERINL